MYELIEDEESEGDERKDFSSAVSTFSPVDGALRSPSPAVPAALGPSVVPLYELQAMIHHRGHAGTATSGHYFCDLKSSEASSSSSPTPAPAQWRRYDDSFVRQIDDAQALQYGETNGYILFYAYQPLLNIEHAQDAAKAAAAHHAATVAAAAEAAQSAAASLVSAAHDTATPHALMRF